MEQGGLSKVLAIVYELGKPIAFFVVALFLFHFFIATIFVIDGSSMESNFHTGQIVLVNKIAFLTSEPRRGDVVVLRFPGDPVHSKYIKRIVALPGEKVEIKNGAIYINGGILKEAYLGSEAYTPTDNIKVKVLGASEYFLTGDNRTGSSDSRIWGPARKEDLIGRTRFILYPFSNFGYITDVFYK